MGENSMGPTASANTDPSAINHEAEPESGLDCIFTDEETSLAEWLKYKTDDQSLLEALYDSQVVVLKHQLDGLCETIENSDPSQLSEAGISTKTVCDRSKTSKDRLKEASELKTYIVEPLQKNF